MAKSDPNLLTQAEYARSRKDRGLTGASREAVRKAVERNHVSVFGPDKLIDKALADSQWQRNTRTRVAPASSTTSAIRTELVMPGDTASNNLAPPGVGADPSYMQFRMRREQADAQIAEMNAAKMKGTMVVRADVDRAFFEIGREVRDRLTACARRIASEVAALPTAEACEVVVDREHRIVLELLVTSVREKIGAPVSEAS